MSCSQRAVIGYLGEETGSSFPDVRHAVATKTEVGARGEKTEQKGNCTVRVKACKDTLLTHKTTPADN